MGRMTPGNKLYLYRLLSTQVGIGKQVSLAQVEEVLVTDGIVAEDLGFEDVSQLLEELGDFVRLTVFKKGRIYATVARQESYDGMLARLDSQASAGPTDGKASGTKSWKHKKSSKDPKPAKPRPKARRKKDKGQVPGRSEPAREASEPTTEAPSQTQEHAASVGEVAPSAETKPLSQAEPAPAPQPPADEDPMSAKPAQDAEVAPAEGPVGAEESQPVEAPSFYQSLLAQIEAQSYEDDLEDGPLPGENLPLEGRAPEAGSTSAAAGSQGDAPVASASEPASPGQAPAPGSPSQVSRPSEPTSPMTGAAAGLQLDLPQDFAAEVYCRNEPLSLLYQLLPFDAEPLTTLTEDWRYARSTGAFEGTRSSISFPLRYKAPSGDASLRANLRRSAKGNAGKHWMLESVEVIDDQSSQACSPEDVAEGIAAAPLEPNLALDRATSEVKTRLAIDEGPDGIEDLEYRLAHLFVIGTWTDYLSELASLAQAEDWSWEGRTQDDDGGARDQESLGLLRAYMAVTLHCASAQLRLQVSEDRTVAAFDTGLLSRQGQRIFDLLLPNRGDIAWQHAGFCVAGEGQLGLALADSFPMLPEAVRYLSSLDEVLVPADAQVELADGLRDNLVACLGARETDRALGESLARVRAGYRTAAAGYDTTREGLCLLAPFHAQTLGGEDVTCALALGREGQDPDEKGPGGARYHATDLVSLARARLFARVVSADLPSWLMP